MANIPVVQIPNAPQTGSTAVPLPVGAIRTPDIEYMGVVEDASYMAIGRAYENLGAAGQQAASVLNDFAFSMAKASDEANLVRADDVKTELLSKYYAEVATKPENEWSNIWDSKYADRLATEVGDMQMMTRDGANRRDSWLQSTQSAVKADIFTKSNQKMIERARMSFDNSIERKVENGDYEGAFADIARRGTSGLSSPEEDERDKLKIERVVKWENVTGSIQASPHEVVRDLEAAVANGTESKLFKNLKTPSDRAKALNMAYAEQRRMDGATVRDAVEEIFTGSITDPAQIDERFSKLDRKDRESLKATLEATPEQIAKRLQTAPAVQQMINAYDPQEDFDGTKAISVRQFIKQLPEGYQRDYLDQLNDKIRNNKPEPPTAVGEIKKLAKSDFDAMRYGKWKVNQDGDPTNDEESAKRDAAMLSYSREMTAFDRWAKRNPDATDEEAYAEINRIRRNIYEADKADGKESARMPNMTAPDPRDAQRKARELRGQPQASADGVYREGNIGPTSTGPHFDIKREDRGFWDRTGLDAYVLVNGEPLSTGKTVSGGRFGAPRSYGAHKGWDFAFGGNGNLTLTNGAVWLGVHSTKHGDKARFQTPDGAVYEILHGKFDSAS